MFISAEVVISNPNSHSDLTNNKLVYFAAIIASLGGFVYGYGLADIAGAILFVKDDFFLSDSIEEVVIGSALLGAMFGAIFGGAIVDRHGRRRTMVVTAFISIIGNLVIVLAPGVDLIILGRFIVGFGFGMVSFCAPLYISEISPVNKRGKLVSIFSLAIMLGVLAAYIIDYAFSGIEEWRWMFGIGIIPAIFLAIGIHYSPKSPRWLVMHGNLEKARSELVRLRGVEEVDQELEAIKCSLSIQTTSWKDLLAPSLRFPLFLGICLGIIRQATGVGIAVFYAPTVFLTAGFSSSSVSILATVGLGVLFVVMTVVAMFLVDKIGRRPLILIGLAGMVISLAVLGWAFSSPAQSAELGWIAVITLMSFTIFFTLGPGSVVWLLVSEIYPSKVRGMAMSVATLALWGAYLLVTVTFLTLVDILGRAGTFWFYALIGIAAFIFVYFLVPETKGKSLEEIEKFWEKE